MIFNIIATLVIGSALYSSYKDFRKDSSLLKMAYFTRPLDYLWSFLMVIGVMTTVITLASVGLPKFMTWSWISMLGDGSADAPSGNILAAPFKSGSVIISVNYQKAPEHPFPIPFDDCYSTLLWAAENAAMLGIEPSQIGVGGDSAGGNLAAGVAIKARDTGDVNLAFQLLIYPCNDNEMNYESAHKNGDGYGLSTRAMKWFWEQYLSKKSDAKNPYAVPVAAKDFKNLAPAIITTAEFDPLLDDGYIYAELLRKSGVPTIYREYEGVIHGYFTLAGITPEAEVLHRHVTDEINALLAR